jgi:hypothetical protein
MCVARLGWGLGSSDKRAYLAALTSIPSTGGKIKRKTKATTDYP